MILLPTLQSLSELCAIRISYSMWTRRDVVHRCSKEELFVDEEDRTEEADMQNRPFLQSSKDEIFDEFEGLVSDDVQSLPLPEHLKSRVLNNVKPVGKRFLSLLYLWLSKTQPEHSQEWLTDEMLSECLILNAVGLIDDRKTAEKILSSRMLPNVLAFRLACVNFLEDVVLNLWMHVRQYFLNKIILDAEQPSPHLRYFMREIDEFYPSPTKPGFPRTTEPDEVLFWISFCLSKENGVTIDDIPHFMGNKVDWYEFSLDSSVFSGNVACFDYFNKIKIGYNRLIFVERIFRCYNKDRAQLCLIFLLRILKSRERKQVMRQSSMFMVSHFLRWPLSQTFLENIEETWNLIPNEYKGCVFIKIFAILFAENILLNPVADCGEYPNSFLGVNTLTHNAEHLKTIWIALWEISSHSDKLPVLNEMVLKAIECSRRRRGFRANFKASSLKEKLRSLFLSNGEAVLELFESISMKKSLKSLVAKYFPEDFEYLDNRCISFLKSSSVQYRLKMKRQIRKKVWVQNYQLRHRFNPLHGTFLDYIRKNFRRL